MTLSITYLWSKKMATYSIVAGPENVNTGTALYPGAVTSEVMGSLAFDDNHTTKNNLAPTRDNGLVPCFVGTAVTLTSVANNGSGKCRFTKSSHGRSVGDVIFVAGSTTGNLDRTHVITDVPTSNTFDTDVDYVASATAGEYTRLARVYNNPTGAVISMVGGDNTLAGTADTTLNGASDFGAALQNPFKGSRRLNITAWDYETGDATFGSNKGVNVSGHDPVNDTSIDVEPQPTRDEPGTVTYKTGAALPVTESYNPW